MLGLLQRVSQAPVIFEGGNPSAAIGRGLLVLVGVGRDDDEANADRLLGHRVFPDGEGK